jgi:hypothetical protein
VQDRRFRHLGDDEHVHRILCGITLRADGVGQPHVAEDFHGAGVAAFHFRQPSRGRIALGQQDAYAALAQVNGQCQANRAGPGNDHLMVAHALIFYGWLGWMITADRMRRIIPV